MASVLEIRDRLAKLTGATLRKEVANLILSSKEVIKAKEAELKAGLRPSKEIIGTYKSEEYKREKMAQNPSAGGTVDLIREGDFKKGLFIQNPKPTEFLFESTDEKAEMLFEKYGEDLKGLNQKDFEDVWNLHLAGKYREALRKITGL
ncbi:hypothetical protein ACJRPK_13835 [Aquimarina sp. 2-A2]|uniref:hypothetical protein n=1 Tax=Aquimarina sp. 2-A2 TaxID=3382644 RepID=UPI00387F21AA